MEEKSVYHCCYCSCARIGFDKSNTGRLYCVYDLDKPVLISKIENCPIEKEKDDDTL